MPPGQEPLVLFTTLARDERLFERFFAGGLLDRAQVTLRQREIVIDWTTSLCRSEYEWGVHIAFFAAKVGLTAEQIRSLANGSPEDVCCNASEALLIRFCDELHHTATVSDELWTALRCGNSDEAMLELLMLAGFYHRGFAAHGTGCPNRTGYRRIRSADLPCGAATVPNHPAPRR
jgi:hypothetical protein